MTKVGYTVRTPKNDFFLTRAAFDAFTELSKKHEKHWNELLKEADTNKDGVVGNDEAIVLWKKYK